MIYKKDLKLLPKNHGYEMDESEDTRKRFDSYLEARQYLINVCDGNVGKCALSALIRDEVHFCDFGRVFSRTYFVENFAFVGSDS